MHTKNSMNLKVLVFKTKGTPKGKMIKTCECQGKTIHDQHKRPKWKGHLFVQNPNSKVHCPDSKSQQHTNNQIAKCQGPSPTQRATMQWRTNATKWSPPWSLKSTTSSPKKWKSNVWSKNAKPKGQRQTHKAKREWLIQTTCNSIKVQSPKSKVQRL